jgi:hypothetical protein
VLALLDCSLTNRTDGVEIKKIYRVEQEVVFLIVISAIKLVCTMGLKKIKHIFFIRGFDL